MSQSFFNTRAGRQSLIVEIITKEDVSSQTELQQLLIKQGYSVTQATLSRDLEEIGAIKMRGADGSGGKYVVPEDGNQTQLSNQDKLLKHLPELLLNVQHNGNIAMLKTPPGAAQFLAGLIDRSKISQIMGTIAGDDTIMLISTENHTGQDIVEYMESILTKDHKN